MKDEFSIINKNLLFADFLDFHLNSNYEFIPLYNLGQHSYFLDELKFHTDWNWLKLILNKINDLSKKDKMYLNLFKEVTIFSDINIVYVAALNAIEYYNKNKNIN